MVRIMGTALGVRVVDRRIVGGDAFVPLWRARGPGVVVWGRCCVDFAAGLNEGPFASVMRTEGFTTAFPTFANELGMRPSSSACRLRSGILACPTERLTVRGLALFESLLMTRRGEFFEMTCLTGGTIQLRVFAQREAATCSCGVLR